MKYQLHVSALNTLSRCGEQFRRRYIEGERIPPGVALVIGTAVDRSVTANLARKIEAGCLLPPDEVADIARDTLLREWERGVQITTEDEDQGYSASRDEAIDTSVSLARLHYTQAAPLIQPTHVARKWVLDIDGLPIQLAGEIDVQEGLRSIRDTKTTGRTPKPTAADHSLQLSTYSLAVRQIDGAIPERVILDFCVHGRGRGGEVKYVPVASTRTDEQLSPLLARIVQAAEAMDRGVFTPALPDSWQCSPRWCGYWATCRYALRPVSVTVHSRSKKGE